MRPNVLIADDHSLFRKALRNYLVQLKAVEEIYEAEDGHGVISMVKTGLPIQLILLDIKMPKIDGLELAIYLRQNFPKIKILIVTSYDEAALVNHAIEIGIKGYMTKNDEDIAEAITNVMEGKYYFSKEIKQCMSLAGFDTSKNRGVNVSKRKRQVLKLLSDGYSTKEIADQLKITSNSVESHRKELLDQFDVNNSVQLISQAYKNGLL